jgi:protein-L-isoaspartate(D-aspartate) O-methyltransferase
MLDVLNIQSGPHVYEIGTGSGWNAALMAYLVGPTGHVYTMEILPDWVTSSQQDLQGVGVESVTVLARDCSAGYGPGAPFDRIIFTAGSYDVPLAIHQQLKEGGLLLAVLKIPGGGDDLVLLRK